MTPKALLYQIISEAQSLLSKASSQAEETIEAKDMDELLCRLREAQVRASKFVKRFAEVEDISVPKIPKKYYIHLRVAFLGDDVYAYRYLQVPAGYTKGPKSDFASAGKINVIINRLLRECTPPTKRYCLSCVHIKPGTVTPPNEPEFDCGLFGFRLPWDAAEESCSLAYNDKALLSNVVLCSDGEDITDYYGVLTKPEFVKFVTGEA